MLRTRRVENLRHGALTTTAGTREGSTITRTRKSQPRTGHTREPDPVSGYPPVCLLLEVKRTGSVGYGCRLLIIGNRRRAAKLHIRYMASCMGCQGDLT